MHYYHAFGLNIRSEMVLPELLSAETEVNYDLTIQTEAIHCPEVSKTRIFRRGIQAGFGTDTKGNLYLRWEGIAIFRATAGKTLAVHFLTDDHDLLSLFTVSEALGLILFQRSLLLLHASAVMVGNEAWCFMGEPGAGKSTSAAAFVKYGCPLLSDDLTAIHLDERGIPYIIPAYPQLKIWDETVSGLNYDRAHLQPVSEGVNKFSFMAKADFPRQPVRLSRVFFLHKDSIKPSMDLLHRGEVPAEFIKNFPLPTELLTGDYLKTHFFQSLTCAAQADIFYTRRPAGFAALEEWVLESIREKTTHLEK